VTKIIKKRAVEELLAPLGVIASARVIWSKSGSVFWASRSGKREGLATECVTLDVEVPQNVHQSALAGTRATPLTLVLV
jgi:hypothetical protein